MQTFLTPEELWNRFEINGVPEHQILKTDQFGEYEYQQVLFDGHRYPDGTTKIFGVFACDKSASGKSPCVLLVHDFGGKVDYSYIDYFLNLGFSVLMCDYYGFREGERHTIYPPSRDLLNHCNSPSIEADGEIEDSIWIAGTLINRYAINFLRTLPNVDSNKIGVVSFGLGSIIGFHLAFCEPSLALSVNFHYGGWRDFEKLTREMDFQKAKHILALAPQAYSPIAKVPLFLLGSTNTRIGDTDRIFETFSRCNGEISNFLYLSPNYISTVDHYATRNLRLLLNHFLKDSRLAFPMMPRLNFEIAEGRLWVTCNIETEFAVRHATLYFSQGDNPPHLRAYNSLELVSRGDGNFIGSLDVSSSLPTVAICNVELRNGYTLTSNQLKIQAFGTDTMKHNVITLGNRETFFPLGTLSSPTANQFFKETTAILETQGAFGIHGISSPRIASFAFCDPCLEKEKKTISLQLYSDLPQKVRLLLSVSDNHEANFSTTIDLVGGEFWQKILLDPDDFASGELEVLDSFEECKLLFFTSEYDFIISNMTMV